MAAQFKLNPAGIREMLKGSIGTAATEPEAQAALGRAKAAAPVDTGAYRDSIHLVHEQHPQRTAFHIVSDDPAAMLIEANHGTLASSL
jgi:hypothetical protein